jgi:hypothetical protein
MTSPFKILTLLATALALTTGSLATAASINARQVNQKRLIDAGKRSGKLTQSEARMLDAEQRTITQTYRRLKAQHRGNLTRNDHARIKTLQINAGYHIAQQKNDRQRGRNRLKI